MYCEYSFGRGNIVFINDDYYMILSCDSHDGNLIMMQLTGEYAGVTYFRTMVNIVDKIEKHYFDFSDLIKSFCSGQKKKIEALNNKVQKINNQLQYFIDRDEANKNELDECYSIIDFKNKEIERLQKEALCTVNKDNFDKAVNDMLNSKDISTVEEVSALMKIRALLY